MPNWRIGKISFNIARMEIIVKGIVSGIVLAFLIGPVFFTLLQTSIERGFSSGVFVAIGISLSDSFYILISYFGLTQFMSTPNFRHYMAYGGGVFFCFLVCIIFLLKAGNWRSLIHKKLKTPADSVWLRKGFLSMD